MKKSKQTYQDVINAIVTGMKIGESSADDYPDFRAAVSHYVQSPDMIPQGLPPHCEKTIQEYRPNITGDLFNLLPYPPPKNHDFRFIDLFAGIGGFRLAFQKTGGKCVFTSEWDKYAKQTYEANFGEIPYGDIRQIDKGAIPEFDVLCAGFPCQPFQRSFGQNGN